MKNLTFADYKRIRRYTPNQLDAWVTSIYTSGLEDGAEPYQEAACYTDAELRVKLKTIKGVGPVLAERIADALEGSD